MVSYYYHPAYSGAAEQCRNLCRALGDVGVETLVVSARYPADVPHRDVVDDSPVSRIPIIRRNRVSRLLSFWAGLSGFLVANRRNFDIIHVHATLHPGPASVVGHLLGKRSLMKVTMAGDDLAFQNQGRVFGRVNRFFAQRFDRYVATSREIREEFAEVGFNTGRVVHLPNAVDTHRYRPVEDAAEKARLRAELGLPSEPLAIFVGALLPRKNVQFLLDAWKRLKDRGVQGKLLLLGPTDLNGQGRTTTYVEQLKEFVDTHGLRDHVLFLGFRENVADYLRASDAFLFATRLEGMPNVLLEAMACGLPTVSSRVSGVGELIQHGKNGFLIDQEDLPTFTETAFEVLTGSVPGDIGENARRTIEEGYSLEALARRYRELYLSLLD
jgi:glycosyltransferase involved in cell wall biosynthesis